jgi:hypothetical protein
MRRKRRSRKQTKLSPGIVFLLLCLGVVVAAFQKSEKPAVDPQPNQVIENKASEPRQKSTRRTPALLRRNRIAIQRRRLCTKSRRSHAS